MSLINDALKRANEAKPPPPAADVGAPPLRPAEHPARRPLWVWLWYTVALLVAGFLASWAIVIGILASRELQTRPVASARETTENRDRNTDLVQEKGAASPGNLQPASVSVLAQQGSSLAPLPAEREQLSPLGGASTNQNLAANTSSPTNTVAAAAAPAETPKPAVPTLKLQGIFYRPVKPLAMINAKMVGLGEKILNAKVLAIDRESVTIEKDGQTTVLTLP